MKKLNAFLLLLFVLLFSCHEKSSISPSCADCGPKVEDFDDGQGAVSYDSKAQLYYVTLHVPGTIDSFIGAYTCDLPDEFKEEGKQVILSGMFYETSIHSEPPLICCWEAFYCAEISSIRSRPAE
jgi:hypothetical protein